MQGREDSAFSLTSAKVQLTKCKAADRLPTSCYPALDMPVSITNAVLQAGLSVEAESHDRTQTYDQIAAHQQDSWQHLQPTVMAPFEASADSAPREILVQR